MGRENTIRRAKFTTVTRHRPYDPWKKLDMLPDSFEVSTSNFDLSHPPRFLSLDQTRYCSAQPFRSICGYFCRMHKQAERNIKLRSGRSSTATSTTPESTTTTGMLASKRRCM